MCPDGTLPPPDKKLKPIPKLSARKENGTKPSSNSNGNDSKNGQANNKVGSIGNGRKSPSNGYRPKSPVTNDTSSKPQASNSAPVRPKSTFLQNLQNEKKTTSPNTKTFDSNGRKTPPPISDNSKSSTGGNDTEKSTSPPIETANGAEEKASSKSSKNKGKCHLEK